jgi:hypothetical protein
MIMYERERFIWTSRRVDLPIRFGNPNPRKAPKKKRAKSPPSGRRPAYESFSSRAVTACHVTPMRTGNSALEEAHLRSAISRSGYLLGLSRKKRSISLAASGPRGSV